MLLIFEDTPIFSHINQKVSARAVHIDVAEHRATLENHQSTTTTCPKTRASFSQISCLKMSWFYCVPLYFFCYAFEALCSTFRHKIEAQQGTIYLAWTL